MSPDAAAMAAAWARTSRFQSLGLVLDLDDADAGVLLSRLRSDDARAAVGLARRAGHRFIALSGQLLRKRGGAFTASTADAAALPLAAAAAAARLAEAGERCSLWTVLLDDAPREGVLRALTMMSATAGHA